jgi:hypothetical protein
MCSCQKRMLLKIKHVKALNIKKNVVFWMLRRVVFIRTNVSEERIAFIISVTRIGKLGTTLAVTIVISSQSASVACYCYRCS